MARQSPKNLLRVAQHHRRRRSTLMPWVSRWLREVQEVGHVLRRRGDRGSSSHLRWSRYCWRWRHRCATGLQRFHSLPHVGELLAGVGKRLLEVADHLQELLLRGRRSAHPDGCKGFLPYLQAPFRRFFGILSSRLSRPADATQTCEPVVDFGCKGIEFLEHLHEAPGVFDMDLLVVLAVVPKGRVEGVGVTLEATQLLLRAFCTHLHGRMSARRQVL